MICESKKGGGCDHDGHMVLYFEYKGQKHCKIYCGCCSIVNYRLLVFFGQNPHVAEIAGRTDN